MKRFRPDHDFSPLVVSAAPELFSKEAVSTPRNRFRKKHVKTR
jgi:hypothetical protein